MAASRPVDRSAILDPTLIHFVHSQLGPVREVTDSSWPRPAGRVWRLVLPQATYFLKQHLNDRFHHREVTAYRQWVPVLGDRAPRLVAADAALRAVVVTAVSGHSLHAADLAPALAADVQLQIGQLVRCFHQSAPARPAVPLRADKLERHLAGARPYLADGDEDLLRTLAGRLPRLPAIDHVPTHGDLQLRNTTLADGRVYLYDFERSEYGSPTRDVVRLADTWSGRPELSEAFFTGFGRQLTPGEVRRLECEAALDAVSGVAFGSANGDPEVVQRGLRTLHQLRTGAFP